MIWTALIVPIVFLLVVIPAWRWADRRSLRTTYGDRADAAQERNLQAILRLRSIWQVVPVKETKSWLLGSPFGCFHLVKKTVWRRREYFWTFAANQHSVRIDPDSSLHRDIEYRIEALRNPAEWRPQEA